LLLAVVRKGGVIQSHEHRKEFDRNMKPMDRRWIAVVVIVAVALSVLVGFFAYRIPPNVQTETRYPAEHHSPFTISSEGDFTKPGAGSGCECVRSGSGTEADPFLISDWIINSTDTDGIVIFGTSVHFLIARVELRSNDQNRGFYISDAQNGVIEDSQITDWWFGVFIFHSSNFKFIHNTVQRNQYGIQLEASNNNELSGNRFEENAQLGIFLRGPNNVLRDNYVIKNGWGGINVDGTAGTVEANLIEGNVVSDNPVFGIGVWRAANNILRNNTVVHNQMVGIMLTDHCTQNLIEANTVSNNGGSGIILVDGSSNNTIRQNTAKGNGDGVKDFDLYDRVSGNTWENNMYDTKKPDTIN
jgi:parallel beta-helix repeat protein